MFYNFLQYKIDPSPEPSDEEEESSDEEDDGFGSKKKTEDDDPAASKKKIKAWLSILLNTSIACNFPY